jgi:hypothetical protein
MHRFQPTINQKPAPLGGLFAQTIKKEVQPTSLAANLSVNHNSIRNRIVCELFDSPKTDEELETILKMKHQTVSAARRGCVIKELVCPTGKTRATNSGRMANVWELTSIGVSLAHQLMHDK